MIDRIALSNQLVERSNDAKLPRGPQAVPTEQETCPRKMPNQFFVIYQSTLVPGPFDSISLTEVELVVEPESRVDSFRQ